MKTKDALNVSQGSGSMGRPKRERRTAKNEGPAATKKEEGRCGTQSLKADHGRGLLVSAGTSSLLPGASISRSTSRAGGSGGVDLNRLKEEQAAVLQQRGQPYLARFSLNSRNAIREAFFALSYDEQVDQFLDEPEEVNRIAPEWV